MSAEIKYSFKYEFIQKEKFSMDLIQIPNHYDIISGELNDLAYFRSYDTLKSIFIHLPNIRFIHKGKKLNTYNKIDIY